MSTTYWLKFGNTALGYNGSALKTEYTTLPAKSVRFKFPAGHTPTQDTSFHQWEWNQVSTTPNVWDLTIPTATQWSYLRNSNSALASDMGAATEIISGDLTGATLAYEDARVGWVGFFMGLSITRVGPLTGVSGNLTRLFYRCYQLEEVISIEGTGILNVAEMFQYCSSLVSAPSFDTSAVGTEYTESGLLRHGSFSDMYRECSSLREAPIYNTSNAMVLVRMFEQCTSLRHVPLYDTSSAISVQAMFYNCSAVVSGALALYNQMAGQTTPPTYHTRCFYNCGAGTPTGAAELAQIPSGWKSSP